MDPKSTHHEQPMVRAVHNTASSRTLTGSCFDARSIIVSCTAPATISLRWCAATAKGSGTWP